MTRIATVLYEDMMQPGIGGAYPAHDLVLQMVADCTGRSLWELRNLIDKNPRNGISKVIADVGSTSLLAGAGVLCILVDSDKVAEQLGLPATATEHEIVAAFETRSDDKDRLAVFLLHRNMEGLLRSIEECDPTNKAPPKKGHIARDLCLNNAAFKASTAVRDCIKGRQPGVAALVAFLVARCGGDES